jgi:hypothetical protein
MFWPFPNWPSSGWIQCQRNTNAARPSPLEPTQLTNNGQIMPTRLIHVFNFHHQPAHMPYEISSPSPLLCTLTDTNDYIYSKYIVPLTLYAT